MADIRAGGDVHYFANVTTQNFVVNNGGRNDDMRQDVFRPSFYTSPNPREVLLDFELPSGDMDPATPEARMLREVLGKGINERKTKIVSIFGKAGVGKSCILRALGDEKFQKKLKLKEHFPGGIYFLSLGMDASESDLIRELADMTEMCGGKELGKELRGGENLRIVVKKMKEWMGGKKCLVLMDDFWKRNGLKESEVREIGQIFNEESGSVLVMTTRFMDLALLGILVEVEERKTMSKEAEAILLSHAKFEREEVEKEEVESFYKVLKMCGGLPLFLSVAGRAVAHLRQVLKCKGSRTPVWVHYWERLETMGQDELMETKYDKYPELSKTLRLSLELLSERQGNGPGSHSAPKLSFQEMHRALCVFKKQERIPISVCRRLWNLKSTVAATKIGEWFAGIGLADIESRKLNEKDVVYIRLHDLVHMFAMECARDKGDISAWHTELLEGYAGKGRGTAGVRKWWEICKKACNDDERDEYLFKNVCRHLVSSGNVKELEGLLVSGEWSQLRHEVGGLSAWKGDFWECLEGMKRAGDGEIGKGTERGLEMVRDAVVESWTYVHANPGELGYQVFGRLIDCENEIVKRYLRSIKEVLSTPWVRPMQRCWERPGEGMIIGEFGLGDDVWDIALHKKSFTAVVGFGEEVAIIDLKEMRVTGRCAGHNRRVRKVGISGDGKRAFSWSSDGIVRHWNVESGEEHKDKHTRIEGTNDIGESHENDRTRCAAFSAENDFVVTGSEGGEIKIWESCSGKRVGQTMDTYEIVSCLAMSPNGRIVAAGLRDGSILFCDVETSRPMCEELHGHDGEIRDIAFSTDGRVVASLGDDAIWLWDVESKRQVGDPFVSCMTLPYSVAFSEDSKQIFAAYGGGLSVWDVASGAKTHVWRARNFWVNCAAVISNDGSLWAVSGNWDGMVRVWDVQLTPEERDEHINQKVAVSCVAAGPDGSFFVSGSLDGTLQIWDGVDGKPLGETVSGHYNFVTSVTVSPDGRWVLSGSYDGTLCVWDVGTGARVGDVLQAHLKQVNCVAYSPNGKFVISGSDDQTVRVWRVVPYCESDGSARNVRMPARTARLKRIFRSLRQHASGVLGSRMRVAGRGAGERQWNRDSLCLQRTLWPELANQERYRTCEMNCVAVSQDGQRVLSGSEDGDIYVWDMNSGRCIDRKQSHNRSAIVRMEISEDDEILIMNKENEESRWRFDNGHLIRALHSEEGIEIGRTERQEGSVSSVFSDVLCRGRIVQLGCRGQKIATLPDEVYLESWTYNAKSGRLCIGFEDGRVWFFQVVF